MTNEESIRILSQIDSRQEMTAIGGGEWVVLYGYRKDETKDRFYFSGLIPERSVTIAMSQDCWDLSVGDGLPGIGSAAIPPQNPSFMSAIGTDSNRIRWSFWKSSVTSITFITIGTATAISELMNGARMKLLRNVRVRKSEQRHAGSGSLLQLGARISRYILIFWLLPRWLLRLPEPIEDEDFRGGDLRYSFRLGEDTLNGHTFSRLYGKKLITPPPIRQCGIWPYDERTKQFAEYIIGVDSAGEEVRHTCDPDALANYFGKNPDAPNFLTPIWFKKDVLQKYYANSDKYSVEDGYIRCGSLWGLAVDNDHLDSMVHDEQLYWQTFNVTPEGRRLSKTNVSRSFRAEFEDPTAADLVFKSKFAGFQELWEHVGTGGAADEKSVSKLQRYLSKHQYPFLARDVDLLRSVQSLRSTGAAHRRGSPFSKESRSLGLDSKPKPEVFGELLKRLNCMLDDLSEHFIPSLPE